MRRCTADDALRAGSLHRRLARRNGRSARPPGCASSRILPYSRKKGGDMLTRRSLLCAAASTTLASLAAPAFAEIDFPNRVIRILVGYPAGGGVDIVARLVGEHMRQAWGQSVIVENRSGASAMIASNAVAKAAPDGYTLLAAASGEVAINQHLFKDKMTYDARRELTPVALIGVVPCVVVVATSTPIHNPKELIDYAKANAGKLSFSSSGVGNPQQLAGELMNSMAGPNVPHVPYRGPGPGGGGRA